MRKGNLVVDAKPESIGPKLNRPLTKKKLAYFKHQAKPVTFYFQHTFLDPYLRRAVKLIAFTFRLLFIFYSER